MNDNSSFSRKVFYGLCMAVLLVPLYLLSRPSVRDKDGLTEGGTLAQLRSRYELSQADLGEIDPASESMKLATLGLRGVAANILWERANRYKRDSDWDNFAATLNQISKLQPNFLSVWQYQGWNISYNVSVEFDDYRTRYLWVKRGIRYLRDGIRYNSQEPILPWEIGWTMGHKIGKADEYVQYRRLYREDRDFHEELAESVNMDNTRGPDNRPDNWKTGREWLLRAQQMVDGGVPIRGRLVDDRSGVRRGKTPLIFHSHPAKWLMSYASAIEEEGFLDEKAQFAWRQGGQEWEAFGQREIPTSYGFAIRLNDRDRLLKEAADYGRQLDELLPGVRQQIEDEKRQLLEPEEAAALAMPPAERNGAQAELARIAERRIRVPYAEIAARAKAEQRKDVRRLVTLGMAAEEMADAVYNYRDQVNYAYWAMRCEVEQTDTAIRARKLVFEADRAFRDSDLNTARAKYDEAWTQWAEIFAKYPEMMEDTTAEDLVANILNYRRVLGQLDEPFPPANFPLLRLLEVQSRNMQEE